MSAGAHPAVVQEAQAARHIQRDAAPAAVPLQLPLAVLSDGPAQVPALQQ